MKNYKITVFTPTYNRDFILENLYRSLVNQTYINFEWVIVDDGSTDNTKQLINKWKKEKKIEIRYYYQNNLGKHVAINHGIDVARGEVFFIVDSDDWLLEKSLEIINKRLNEIPSNEKENYAGVCGLRSYPNGSIIGTTFKGDSLDTNYFTYRYEMKILGDKAEVYFTDILKNNKFPVIKDEKILTEAIVWNRISKIYDLKYFNEVIYLCDYLNDGLSHNSFRNSLKNYKGWLLYYNELLCFKKLERSEKIKAITNYYRLGIHNHCNLYVLFKQCNNKKYSILGILLAYPIYVRDLIMKKPLRKKNDFSRLSKNING